MNFTKDTFLKRWQSALDPTSSATEPVLTRRRKKLIADLKNADIYWQVTFSEDRRFPSFKGAKDRRTNDALVHFEKVVNSYESECNRWLARASNPLDFVRNTVRDESVHRNRRRLQNLRSQMRSLIHLLPKGHQKRFRESIQSVEAAIQNLTSIRRLAEPEWLESFDWKIFLKIHDDEESSRRKNRKDTSSAPKRRVGVDPGFQIALGFIMLTCWADLPNSPKIGSPVVRHRRLSLSIVSRLIQLFYVVAQLADDGPVVKSKFTGRPISPRKIEKVLSAAKLLSFVEEQDKTAASDWKTSSES